jgi:hypothetical protein
MAGKKILLVEGADDEHVLKHVCGTRGVQELDEIKPLGSVEQLLESFPVRLKESDIEVLGVVVDADTDLSARWQSLRDRLRDAGYQNVPEHPAPTGTIILPPPDNALLPRVGIWIMPDNQTRGILEDFMRFLVPEGSRLFEHVKSSVAAIPEGERRFSQLAEPKAIVHTWLAWQKEPGKPLGASITARYLDPGVAQVDVLVSWLTQLFFPPLPPSQ